MIKESKRINDGKLSPKQIKNWRESLVGIIGIYAMVMPDEEIQKIRDDHQKWINNRADPKPEVIKDKVPEKEKLPGSGMANIRIIQRKK
jgi:hypothetical protein